MAARSFSSPSVLLRSSVVASLLCVLLTGLATAQSTDRAHTEALARRATERLQALQREADRLTADERTLLGDLRRLEVDRQIKAEELHEVEAQETQVAGELEANAERTRDPEAQETTSRP